MISCNISRSIFDVWVKTDPESGEKLPANLATLEEQVAAMKSSLEVMEFLQMLSITAVVPSQVRLTRRSLATGMQRAGIGM